MAHATNGTNGGDGLSRFTFQGPNLAWALDLYDAYLADPNAVDAETRAFFANWVPPQETAVTTIERPPAPRTVAAPAVDIQRVLAAAAYAQAIRAHGHREATISPVGPPRDGSVELYAAAHGLREDELAALPASVAGGTVAENSANALEAIERLRAIYCGSVGYEFDHVQVTAERQWLRDAAESGRFGTPLAAQGKRILLERLTEVEAFEKFLHTTYLGAKRFSIEGGDVLVPVLDEIISGAAVGGADEVVIGMAHRGRLNVLTHILGKPYEAIFKEFEHGPRSGTSTSDSSDIGWTGDVKYHLGARRNGGRNRRGQTVEVPVIMAPNPSHLEYVNPIVEGMARASQDDCSGPGEPTQRRGAALAILIHGDAAFPGQGIVAETLNLSGLKAYETSGTIHIIVNNQVGFTTDPDQARSTLYASDLAKGFEIPIVHVNADDPEACLAVARMALAYRNTFQRDFLIDLVGYRRWGHNEGDEPTFTQPQLYTEIAARPTVRALLAAQLEREGVIPAGEGDRLLDQALERLRELKMISDGEPVDDSTAHAHFEGNGLSPSVALLELDEHPTAIPEGALRAYNDALHTFPAGFTLNPKLERQLQRRKGALDRPGGIDWALAESLAFAGILSDGTPIRFTGQDVERGTFSQRHL
ncbi:MAG: 2-oxoglutarate dehydrogenase E1 component, partial [Chloroflexi bacterium]